MFCFLVLWFFLQCYLRIQNLSLKDNKWGISVTSEVTTSYRAYGQWIYFDIIFYNLLLSWIFSLSLAACCWIFFNPNWRRVSIFNTSWSIEYLRVRPRQPPKLAQGALRVPHEVKLQCVAGHCYYQLSLSLSFFCFWPTSRNLPCVKICFPQYFGLTRRYMQQKKYFF